MSNGAPVSCLTFDFDGVSIWLRMFDEPSATALSRGEFGARVGVPRLLDLLRREGIAATFFTPGHTVDSFPEICRRIVADGHELAHHGYFHLDTGALDEAGARAELERGIASIERVSGCAPVGYRAPGGFLSQATLELLPEYGFAYDSSLSAQDFEPYYVRIGDSAPRDAPFEPGEESDLVEVPTLTSLIDVPQMEFLLRPLVPGLHANEKVLDTWREELDWMCDRVPDGLFTLVLHPSTIPRGARLGVLERIIGHAKQRGMRFLRLDDAVSDWRTRHPRRGRAVQERA